MLETGNCGWMGNMQAELECKTLREIVWPGAHDSGTGGIVKPYSLVPDRLTNHTLFKIWNFLQERPVLKIFGEIFASRVVNLVKTQSGKIFSQLNSGSRYFDLRLYRLKDKRVVLTHFAVGEGMDSALKSIKLFLEKNPNEIIILNERQREGFDRDTYLKYIESIKDALKDKLVPQNYNLSTTYGELIKTSYRVIYLLPKPGQKDPPVDPIEFTDDPNFWQNERAVSYWPNAQTIDKIKLVCGDRFTKWSSEYPDRFCSMQICFTPTHKQYVISTVLGKTLKSFECPLDVALPDLLKEWGDNEKIRKGMNVLMVDFIDDMAKAIEIIINLNR